MSNMDIVQQVPNELAMVDHQIAFEIERMLQDQPQVELPLHEFFIPGVYARVREIPQGAMFTSPIHKKLSIGFILKGHLSIAIGDTITEIIAPHVYIGQPGAKRVVYCHTDVIWATVHGTDETDHQLLEEELFCNSVEEFNDFIKRGI